MPDHPQVVWRKQLTGQSMAGLAANSTCVIVADRDAIDTRDIFRALDAETGKELWSVSEAARGQLDFGNAPRATPQFYRELVFLFNAFGKLQCVRWRSGEVVWKKDLYADFGGRDDHNSWGTTSSPLIADGKLIVNPGGPNASVVALKPETGEVVWKTPGDKAAFGSLIVATLGGRQQIVGHDNRALSGWDLDSGKQLWRLVPPQRHDFNVPTPIAVGDQLLVTTENNGTRLYRFNELGGIVPEPLATNLDLAPDTHTPVVLGQRLFGVSHGLYCLDLVHGLKTLWKVDDTAFNDYATLVAGGQRVLALSQHGELLLIEAAADGYQVASRVSLFTDDPGVYSHPALVGKQLYVRGSDEVICVNLDPDAK